MPTVVSGLPRLLLSLILLGLAPLALAVRIEVLSADTLERRPITLPDGSEGELIVISGSPVRLRVDDDEITAEYIEFDRESRLLRIVGAGDLTYDDIATQGEDYVVDLSTQEFTAQDVFIFTAPIDIQGVSAERLPGQVNITSGAFSPCSRCNQERQDYSFRAERMRLYPGDRLVAFDVSVLVREAPVLFLPLLVIPLGPQERQPRFSISQGTGLVSNDNGAEVALDWPYVVGASAFGTTSLRYYADVTPGAGNGFTESFFGGRIDKSYIGGGFDHNFYTAQGQGEVDFFYLPAFDEGEGDEGERESTRNAFSFRFAYDTIENLNIPQLSVVAERDDEENQRIGEYGVSYTDTLFGGSLYALDARFFTQGYYDFDKTDDVTLPSYAGRNTPELTYGRVTLQPTESADFSIGPFTLSEVLVDVGVFEDASSPGNRSASLSPKSTAGRLVERHRLSLDTLTPLPGFSVSGFTDFTGRYYTTGERLVNWNSELGAAQDFGVGTLSATFRRDVNEGETPFRFDTLSASQTRTDLASSLVLTPSAWLRLNLDQTYVFVDTRTPDEVGAGPLESRLELFGNLTWLDVTFANDYDFEEEDPGTLDTTVILSSPDATVNGRLSFENVQDFDTTSTNRTDGAEDEVDESETTVEAELGYRNLFSVDLSGGYEYNTVQVDGENEIVGERKPLELGATLGSLEQEDDLPGARLFYTRNLAQGETQELGYEVTGRYGPFTARATQTFDFANDDADETLYNLTWEDVISAEATGYRLVPPSALGLEVNPDGEADFSVSLRDETQPDDDRTWELTYSTTYDRDLETRSGGVGGYRDTQLEFLVELPSTYIGTRAGDIGFRVNLSSELLLADAQLARTYLDNADLVLFSDFFSRFGVQGGLEYNAELSGDGELTASTLEFDEFGVTARVTNEVYVSALLNDIWDFTGTSADSDLSSAFNFQPILYVTWDRCCWALYGSLDTRDGTLEIALGFPGEETGLFQQALDTPLALPRRRSE